MICPWYIPTWNGDLRLLPDPNNGKRTHMSIVKPTLDEVEIANRIGAELLRRGWVGKWDPVTAKRKLLGKNKWTIEIEAPLEQVGPLASSLMRPGPAALTAVTFKDGRCEISSGSPAELEAFAARITAEEKAEAQAASEKKPPYRTPTPPLPDSPSPSSLDSPTAGGAGSREGRAGPLAGSGVQPQSSKTPAAAVTVKRPTPSCPQCVEGSVGPASEVLLAFLNVAEHDQWKAERCVTAIGGLSGHRYLIAHRETARAAYWGRICCDVDDGAILHFHDNAVPPEEEVLATKLILEYREPWLRNEATTFHATDVRYKNPFGGGGDGVADSMFMYEFGDFINGVIRGYEATKG